MTWPSHILMAVALAKGFSLSMPFVVAGSLFPDLVEMLFRRIPLRRGTIFISLSEHRSWSHSILIAFVCLVAAWNVPSVRDFFVGVLFAHILLDAFTVMGVPVLDGKTRRITLFGGKVRTWTLGEAITVAVLVFFAYAVVPSLTITQNLEKLYAEGVIDRYEYEQRKNALFSFFKRQEKQMDIPDFMRVPELHDFSGSSKEE